MKTQPTRSPKNLQPSIWKNQLLVNAYIFGSEKPGSFPSEPVSQTPQDSGRLCQQMHTHGQFLKHWRNSWACLTVCLPALVCGLCMHMCKACDICTACIHVLPRAATTKIHRWEPQKHEGTRDETGSFSNTNSPRWDQISETRICLRTKATAQEAGGMGKGTWGPRNPQTCMVPTFPHGQEHVHLPG